MDDNDQPPNAPTAADEAETTGCGVCGSDAFETAYKTRLCASCRTQLANRPIPAGIRVVVGVALALAVIASIKFPASLRMAIAEERANRAEARSDYANAEKQLLLVTKAYPDYDDGLVSLAKDSYKAGDYEVTVNTVNQLVGRSLDKEDVTEIEQIEADLEKKFAPEPKGTAK
ncbi:MAG TPA: hypothetical protein VGK19_18025 [Capsulimonadaceae bacterium]|jgi:hypothetical protein